MVNIAQFYPRPGTPAAKMKLLRTQVVKARSRALSALFESYHNDSDGLFSPLVGTVVERCLITDKAHRQGQVVGHTKAYVQILLACEDSEHARVGNIVKVRTPREEEREGEI